jgi:hypothetical protein
MNLLILNGPSSPNPGRNPLYRGTDRAHPTYCDSVAKDHDINRLFFWFLEEGGEAGVVHDLQRACRFAELWNLHLGDNQFEVVEVVDGNGFSSTNGELLGFDLSCSYNSSLLQWGLKSFLGLAQLPEPIRELCDLVNRYYAPQLNSQGLFQTFEVASLCLRSMTALQALSPNLYEGGDLTQFSVVALYRVSSDSLFGGPHQ